MIVRGDVVATNGTAAIGGDNGDFALAVHGGAGTMRRDGPSAQLADSYRDGLRRALSAGQEVLAARGNTLDAVTRAVVSLEDDPLFNAGRGSVFTAAGTQEMEAAVMDGRDRRTGAVAGILGPRNPVIAARAVMDHSEQVLLIGEGALSFCRKQGIAFADPDYFYTAERWKALQDELELRRRGLAPDDDEQRRHGTVGAVARDRYGNLAAATSTGGINAKLPGRVGDGPITGAGTFADNATCASRRRVTGSISFDTGSPSRSLPGCGTAINGCIRRRGRSSNSGKLAAAAGWSQLTVPVQWRFHSTPQGCTAAISVQTAASTPLNGKSPIAAADLPGQGPGEISSASPG